MRKILMTIVCAMFFTFGMVFSANALLIIDAFDYPVADEPQDASDDPYPGPGGATGPEPFELTWWHGWSHNTPSIVAAIEKTVGWDQDWGFTYGTNTPDPITGHINSGYVDYFEGATRLLVYDGRHNPAWYLFDITPANLSYGDRISLTNFWADRQGDISGIRLYGDGVPVPEPGLLLLLGSGLIGLAAYGRRKMNI